MSAGKGDKLRKGANLKAYWDNYDAIFRKPKDGLTEEEEAEKRECQDSMSYSEFKKIEDKKV